MVYQRKSGTGGKVKAVAVCLTALLLSLASHAEVWGAITNQRTSATYNSIQAAVDAAQASDTARKALPW